MSGCARRGSAVESHTRHVADVFFELVELEGFDHIVRRAVTERFFDEPVVVEAAQREKLHGNVFRADGFENEEPVRFG